MGHPPQPPEDFGAAFDAAATRLRAAVANACTTPGPWPGRVCAAIDAVLRFAAEDPDSARLLLVDPWEHGEEGVDRREGLLNHFAALLVSGREQLIGAAAAPAVAEEFLVGAVAAVIADRLGAGRHRGFSRHPALAAELSEYVLLPYLGRTRARVWSRLHSAGRPRLLGGEDRGLLSPIDFTDALAHLQGMIGARAQVVLKLPGRFFDCGFSAILERVETLAGDDGPCCSSSPAPRASPSTPPTSTASSPVGRAARLRLARAAPRRPPAPGDRAPPRADVVAGTLPAHLSTSNAVRPRRDSRHPEPGTPAACVPGAAAPRPAEPRPRRRC